MHFEGELVDTMLARELCRLLPIRNYSFIPLPFERPRVLFWPAVRNPRRSSVGRAATWAPGESHNDLHTQTFRQQHGSLKCLGIAPGNVGVGMQWVTVAT